MSDPFKWERTLLGQHDGMDIDLDFDMDRAAAFMTTHARILDRRRFDLITGQGRADELVAAVVAYRNADGGFGWGLEPDLRSPESQPAGALHAFEVFEEAPGATGDLASRLCDWLETATLADGGLPFALPLTVRAGSAPFWAEADPSVSSLHLTAAVVAAAHGVARQDPAVRDHPWLARATDFCWRRVSEGDDPRGTLELRYVLMFLDAIHALRPEAATELDRLSRLLPDTGTLPVEGGAEGEALHPLDFSPLPDRPLRAALSEDVIAADLRRLASLQQEDGGWIIDFVSRSAAGALEWRGYATVGALKVLRTHQRG
ncbi:MAG: hypothetical protein ACRDP8_15055 [Actinopolymorphaceae bacterium]